MIALFVSFFVGVAFVLVVELYVFKKWFKSRPVEEPPRMEYAPASLRDELADLCNVGSGTNATPESCQFLNLIFAFLFQEWRDSEALKRFFLKKINAEIAELMFTKVVGKILQQVKVCDYGFGPCVPVIKSATVMNVTRRSRENSTIADIEKLDLALDLDYDGGFHVSFDADLVFGRRAFVFIKVKKLKGKARVQMSCKPLTHWSFSFYEEPQLDLEVETRLLGRTLPQLSTLIRNQFRKSIRKKHTLPAFKVRHKPFFPKKKPQDENQQIYVCESKIVAGKLTVEVHGARYLPEVPKSTQKQAHTYCTLEISELPRQGPSFLSNRSENCQILEISIVKEKSKSVGILFKPGWEVGKEERREVVIVDSIRPGSAASNSDLQKGDVIIEVAGIPCKNVDTTVKLIKHAKPSFVLTIKRESCFKRSSDMANETPDDEVDASKPKEERSDTDGGGAARLSRMKSLSDEYVMVADSADTIQQTSSVAAAEFVGWKEQFDFFINGDAEFLNICVWNHYEDLESDLLIGHVSIPLMDVALQCMMISSGKHSQHFVLVPALPVAANRAAVKATSGGLPTPGSFPAGAQVPEKNRVYAGVLFLHFQHTMACMMTPEEEEESDSARKGDDSADHPKEPQAAAEPVATRHVHLLTDMHRPEIQDGQHHFIQATFIYQARCDFCKKKMWTKTSFMCRTCNMVSHKKCLLSCQRECACPYRPRSSSLDSKGEGEFADEKAEELHEFLESSSSYTKDEATALSTDALKQLGKEKFSELPLKDRLAKFEAKMFELQENLDKETKRRNELVKREKRCSDEHQKIGLMNQIAKLDHRRESVALLMMQYAEGLSHCEEELAKHLSSKT